MGKDSLSAMALPLEICVLGELDVRRGGETRPLPLSRHGPALGVQAGEARLREVVVRGGGFTRFRRATLLISFWRHARENELAREIETHRPPADRIFP